MAVSLGPEEEIRIMLEQVRAAAQNEEKSALLDALLSMADCGPDICESFFTALSLGPTAHKAPPGNLFELCLDILSDSSAAIAAQMVQVLLVVSQKVGLGMPALRRMMQQLFNDSGEWSENARQIVLCTARMAQLEGDAKSRAANGAEPLHFFVLDGVSSGLYLGGDSNWAWSEGYTFAAWVWKDGNEPGDVTLLHLVGGEVEDSVLQLVIRTDKRGGGSAAAAHAHLVLLVGHGSRLTQVDTQVAIPTSKWTRVALAHEYNKLKTSVVTTWVDASKSVTALKYPAQQSNVRAYAGCSSYSRHGANHPGATHAQQARRFKGLLGTVSLWNKALSYSDVVFAHTLDARNSGETRGQDDEGEWPRPRYCASPGSVVFPPASHFAGNEEQRFALLTCNSCAAGALRVGGRAGLVASLEALGHLDVLMWMLRLAVNESSPDAGKCVEARPLSRAPLQRALACDLLGLTESLITHSALVKAMLRCERGGLAKRLVAGVTQALSCYPLHGSHEELVLALCGLIDCCSQVVLPVAATASCKDHELWAQSLARKRLALHDKMVASWLLNANVWKARHLKQGNVMSFVTERMVKWAQRDPRRLLGNDDFAALFYRLLVLCNDEEQLKALETDADAVEADLALAVCSQLLHPSLAIPQGPDGSLFVRPSLQSLARLILAAGPAVKLVGLKLLVQTMMTWKEAGHFAVLVDMLGDINWPCLLLSIMHDDRAQCEILGLALSALAMYLSNAPIGTRASFVDIGGYAAVEAILCRHNLSLEQQRVCFRAVLVWLSPTEDEGSVRDRNANRADKHDQHIVVLLLRMLEVCDAQVRLEAVRGIKTLLCTSRKAAGAVAAVSGWADLLLRLSLGLGIGGGSPGTAQSVSQAIGNGIYDEVIQVLSAVVQHRLLYSRKGWLTLRDALEALSRFRLPVPGDAADEEGGFGGMGAGVEALESRLTSSARLLLLSYSETLDTLVGSMNRWDADASFRSQSLSGRNLDADLSVKGAARVRDEVAGLLVMVHIFLLSGFSEEQRRRLSEDRLSGDRVPAPSSSDPSVALLLVRGLRITSGGLEGPSIGEASWLDKTIVSKALVLLYTLNSLPDSPHTLCVNDLFFQE